MVKIPIVSDSSPERLQCNVCLLPMQYQPMKNGKFVWQCFKCGKQYLMSKYADESLEEGWSPPR